MPSIQETLGNKAWVQAHLTELGELFPIIPVKVDMQLFLSVGFNIKIMGVDWRSNDDLPKILSFLQKLKLVDIKVVNGEAYVARRTSPSEAFVLAQ